MTCLFKHIWSNVFWFFCWMFQLLYYNVPLKHKRLCSKKGHVRKRFRPTDSDSEHFSDTKYSGLVHGQVFCSWGLNSQRVLYCRKSNPTVKKFMTNKKSCVIICCQGDEMGMKWTGDKSYGGQNDQWTKWPGKEMTRGRNDLGRNDLVRNDQETKWPGWNIRGKNVG
jgi:hypothetical protein